jgi:Flp pilus assembly protein CpaB
MVSAQQGASGRSKPGTGVYTILGVVLALVGFGAVLLFSSLLGGSGKASSGSTAETAIVVAATDIPARTPITKAMLTTAHYATATLPAGAYLKSDAVKDVVAAVEIQKGQPVLPNLLVKSGDIVSGPQNAYLPIPSGWVAIQVPTSEQQGVGGNIQDGDYISIIAVMQGKVTQYTNTRTVFTNVHVLRVGPASGDVQPAGGSSQTPAHSGGVSSSLTVIVTQCQAEYIRWFLQNGSLVYTLEAHQDYKPQDVSPDKSCPGVDSAQGVSRDNINQRWPGLLN